MKKISKKYGVIALHPKKANKSIGGEKMVEVRTYMPNDLNEDVIRRSEELEMSKSEYIRLLASLDVSVQRYQQLVTYINLLHNRINEIHAKLGIYATPLQDVPIVNLN